MLPLPPEDFDDEPELLPFDAPPPLPVFDDEPPPLELDDEPELLPLLDFAPPVFPFDAPEDFDDDEPDDLEADFFADDEPPPLPDLPPPLNLLLLPLLLEPPLLAELLPLDDLLALPLSAIALPTASAALFSAPTPAPTAAPGEDDFLFEAVLPLLLLPPDDLPLDEVVFFAVDFLFFVAIFILSFSKMLELGNFGFNLTQLY